ncbi:MAG: TIGR03960 family B12-binding radical SAM protein [Candidatus Eisenbacteria bacterium]|nr:TIGR03960 family B12-binding radical SAM protein [Candidatus Eisenbacteria bacterium]
MLSHDDQDALARRIAALLPRVEKPARYLGEEINVIRHAWTPERVRWLLILPDLYEIGMSHQGLRILYDQLNRRADALAERAFAPGLDLEALLRREGLPLFSLESHRPARDFDLIGFSLQYELLATNLVNLIDLAGVPIWSRERKETDPLIAAGGPCSGNPEPLADFIDFFLIGDGEEAVGAITETLAATRGRATREERLRRLAKLGGVYVPRFYEPRIEEGRQVGVTPHQGVPARVRRTYVADLDRAPYPLQPIVPLIEAVQDRLTLEIQRGCTQGCRFCQAGIFYRPVRERGPRRLAELTAEGLRASGWEEISLSSLSSADYSQIAPLARTLVEAVAPQRISLSFSSLRVDTFSVELAEQVARVRKTGLTFAPEAGSERLRRVINKKVRDAEILAAAEAAYARGWRRVKLYFMIGLPTETAADLCAMAELIERVRALARRYGRSRSVTASIGAFVPKAHTPFQWVAFDGRRRLREKLDWIQQNVRGRGSELKWHAIDVSFVEAVLSRGDRRLARAIHRAWELGGRFDGWSDHFEIERWETAFRESGIDPETSLRARDPDEPLPWDHIDLGVTREWLQREWQAARAGETTPDCRTGRCAQCGLGGPADRQFAPELSAEAWAELGRAIRVPTAPPELAASVPVRIVFRKRGRVRLLAHLETGHLLVRLLRMAGWPLVFTAGHNPRPKVSFGPPLPLGVEGRWELCDLRLARLPSEEEIARANQQAPAGLTILAARRLPSGQRSLMAEAVAADYRVSLPPPLAKLARREGRIDQFLARGAVPVQKLTKGRSRTIDLRRCVRSLAWDAEATDRLALRLCLQEPAGHVLGPLPALQEIFKWSPEDLARVRVERIALLDAEDRPLHRPVETAS